MKQCVDCVVTLLFQNPPNTFPGGVLGVQTPTHNVICKTRVRSCLEFHPPPSCSWGTKKTHVTQPLKKSRQRSLKEKSNGGPAQTARPWPRMAKGYDVSEDLQVPWSIWWGFPKIGVPQNGWFRMENPITIDDLGVPLFSETSSWWLNQPIWKILPNPGNDHISHLKNRKIIDSKVRTFKRGYIVSRRVVKMRIFPKDLGEHEKYLTPPH